VRVAGHASADTLEKAVVSNLPARSCLILGVARQFGNAGQERFHQRVDECGECRLREVHTPNLAYYAVETCSDSFLRCVDSAYDLRSTYATPLSAGGADECVTQMLRQGDAKVFKNYSQMTLQMKREALAKPPGKRGRGRILTQAGLTEGVLAQFWPSR